MCEWCVGSKRAVDDACLSTARTEGWRPESPRNLRQEVDPGHREKSAQGWSEQAVHGSSANRSPSVAVQSSGKDTIQAGEKTSFDNFEQDCTHVPSVTFQHNSTVDIMRSGQNTFNEKGSTTYTSCTSFREVFKFLKRCRTQPPFPVPSGLDEATADVQLGQHVPVHRDAQRGKPGSLEERGATPILHRGGQSWVTQPSTRCQRVAGTREK